MPTAPTTQWLALLLVPALLPLCPPARAAEPSQESKVPANVMTEFAFTAAHDHENPFHDVTLDVLFESPTGASQKVPAFWDGGRIWKVRFSSPLAGIYHWKTVCSDAGDSGLSNVTGSVTVEPYVGENPLYAHGPLRVAADHRHFEQLDGTPFFWLGDTWWMGLCQRLHWPEEFQRLAADRKAKGFNVVQIVAGLYPDMPAFDPRGANEAGFPWEQDYSRIRPEYFDKADERIKYLVDQGIMPCIVAAWGYHLPWVGPEHMKEHWRYLIARYGALPVVWCACGEMTMPFYRSPHPKEDAAAQKQGWSDIITYIRGADPFGRLITVHPTNGARWNVTDPKLLDFDMHQTGHMDESQIGRMAQQMERAFRADPIMPVIAGESSYDGLDLREWGHGVLSGTASREMFWTGLMNNGAAGGTYGANGIWQVNRAEKPYGPSPHGKSWGSIPWDQAMAADSSRQVGFAKAYFARFPWNHLEPMPQAIAWADASAAADKIRPYCLAMGSTLRIGYLPQARAVVFSALDAKAEYRAELFNPLTGESSRLPSPKVDDSGGWRFTPPADAHDWVVTLDATPTK